MTQLKIDDAAIVATTNAIAVAPPPMFPSTVHIDGVSIRLFADGTWEGDGKAFLAAVERTKPDLTGTTMPILWLIANAIARDRR